MARIWPGYWPPDQAFILYSEGYGALLISPEPAPASFQPLGDSVPGELRGRAFWQTGSLEGVRRTFVTGYPVGGDRTAILVNVGNRPEENVLTLLLHEQFHEYQKQAFERRGGGQFVSPTAIADRLAFAATAEVERRLLARAIGTDDPGTRMKVLRSYFALRAEREATMPADTVRIEKSFELFEGTARYVDRAAHAILAADRVEDGTLEDLLVDELRQRISSESAPFATQWFRERAYSTGAAITYLISRLHPGEWRRALETGALPAELLKSLVGRIAPEDIPALASEAREAIGYEAVYSELRPDIAAAERAEIKTVEEFHALAPYRLVIDAGAAGRGSTAFNARMNQLTPSTVVLPNPQLFNYEAPSVSIVVRDRPVLMEAAQSRYTILVPSLSEMSEVRQMIGPGPKLDALVIETDNVELIIDRPVTVDVSGHRILVQVMKPGADAPARVEPDQTDSGGRNGLKANLSR